MSNLYVEDVSLEDVLTSFYDLAVFTCGYEERCTYLSSVLASEKLGDVFVFGFENNAGGEEVTNNHEYFRSRFGCDVTAIGYAEVAIIIAVLRSGVKRLVQIGQETATVLVDYSSMPRIWYSEILNFFKNHDEPIDIFFDFIYSVGEHVHADTPRQLGAPIILPGCEAVTTYSKKTVAIFGLGFDSGAPICMHGKIEPDITYALIARPGALEDYTKRTLGINSDFIDMSVDEVIYSPLASVKQTYDSLREVFFPFRSSAMTVIVPFGPKPHALASILAAMNYPSVTCLYSSTGSSSVSVVATTDLVMCRVSRSE
jgi:hypothetical protein